MKATHFTLLGAVLLATPSVLGQPARAQQQVIYANPLPQDENLIKFDLDFPGGTPRQLVAAIEKSSSHPLNAVILDEDASVKLPPLKMKSVTAPELFEALAAASPRAEMHAAGNYRS
ncbi:MAG: hypothetical protein DME18_13880, partial [Verrucomicrobia bacterium]